MKQWSPFRRIRAAVVGGIFLHLGSTAAMAVGFSIPEISALGTALWEQL